MVNVKLDMNDPENPIAKVKRVQIAFTAQYAGDDAWNQDQLVPKLEKYLWDNGFSLRGWNLTHSWDKDMNIITDDEMRNYIYKVHGHQGSKCSSCPDPIKWKEVEKLRMKEFLAQKEILDDPKRRPTSGFNWATGEYQKKVVYVLETQEERNNRLKPDKENGDGKKNGDKNSSVRSTRTR